MLGNLWNYRYFVFTAIRKDLIDRYARSRLKAAWMIIHPLAQVAIYGLIFAKIMSGRLPGVDSAYGYTIYLMSGLLAWTLFNEITDRCLNLFVENGNLMKKMYFPRITLPAVVLGAKLFSNLLLLLAMCVVFVLFGHPLYWSMLWLAPLTIILAGFALGVGLLVGVINVFIRDFAQVVPIMLQVWFWFTPIVYPIGIIPDNLQPWLRLNPLFSIVEGYRAAIVYGQAPQLGDLVQSALISVILLGFALFVFRRANPELVDAL